MLVTHPSGLQGLQLLGATRGWGGKRAQSRPGGRGSPPGCTCMNQLLLHLALGKSLCCGPGSALLLNEGTGSARWALSPRTQEWDPTLGGESQGHVSAAVSHFTNETLRLRGWSGLSNPTAAEQRARPPARKEPGSEASLPELWVQETGWLSRADTVCMAARNLQDQACLPVPTAASAQPSPTPARQHRAHTAHLPCSLPLTKTKPSFRAQAGTRQQEMPGPALPSACLSHCPPAPSGLQEHVGGRACPGRRGPGSLGVEVDALPPEPGQGPFPSSQSPWSPRGAPSYSSPGPWERGSAKPATTPVAEDQHLGSEHSFSLLRLPRQPLDSVLPDALGRKWELGLMILGEPWDP